MTEYVDLPLADATLFYGTPYVDGRIGKPDGYADFTWSELIVDPDRYYALQFDVTAERDDAYLSIYSQNSAGDPDASDWWSLGFGGPVMLGDHTVTVLIGPGRDEWPQAVSAGENRLLIELQFAIYVRAARWREVTPTYGPWRSDSDEITSLAYDRTLASANIAGKAWSNLADSEIMSGADFATQLVPSAWMLEGALSSGPSNAHGITWPASSTASWRTAWQTVDVPTTTRSGEGTLSYDPFADPNVIGIEWESGEYAAQTYRAQASLDDLTPATPAWPSVATLPVKWQAGLSGVIRYEPAAQTRPQVASLSTAASLTWSGGSATSAEWEVGAGTFAMTVLDPFSATGSTDGLQTPFSFGWRVTVRAVFHPRYRLIYGDAGAPPTGRRYLRPQRHSQRGDGFNMSSAPRHVQGRTRQSTLRNFGIR